MATMVSHAKQFVFVHVQKTAGNSIAAMLRLYEEHWFAKQVYRRITMRTPGLRDFSCRVAGIEFLAAHATAKAARDIIGADVYSRYLCWAVVRNPWEIEVSRYHFQQQTARHPSHKAVRNLSFEEFLERRVCNGYMTQKSRLSDESGALMVDRVLHLENLQDELNALFQELDLAPVGGVPNKNPSKHGDFRAYYTDKAAELVQNAASDDIEAFGYSFDSGGGGLRQAMVQ